MFRENYSKFYTGFSEIKMTDPEFRKLSSFINTGYGIKLPDNKKVMIQARLQKRLRELNLRSYSDYFELVFGNAANKGEMIQMIDVITTNKTDFFREPVHFDFLEQVVLPEYARKHNPVIPMKIWSAGCSSGEEPYSIAMCISEFSQKVAPLDYRILGTDLSTRILKSAIGAVYATQKTADIPQPLRKKYLLSHHDPKREMVRIAPELQAKINFRRLNFMDRYYQVQSKFDVVFCRNVLIYFERNVQEQVINKICNHIPPGGYFFLGHSESIIGMDVPLKQIKPTIFRKV